MLKRYCRAFKSQCSKSAWGCPFKGMFRALQQQH